MSEAEKCPKCGKPLRINAETISTGSACACLVGRPVSLAEARRIALKILEDAEAERLAFAEKEAAGLFESETETDLRRQLVRAEVRVRAMEASVARFSKENESLFEILNQIEELLAFQHLKMLQQRESPDAQPMTTTVPGLDGGTISGNFGKKENDDRGEGDA